MFRIWYPFQVDYSQIYIFTIEKNIILLTREYIISNNLGFHLLGSLVCITLGARGPTVCTRDYRATRKYRSLPHYGRLTTWVSSISVRNESWLLGCDKQITTPINANKMDISFAPMVNFIHTNPD